MKIAYSLIAAATLANAACAETPPPEPPTPPQFPEVTKTTEDCGEGCERTVTRIVKKDKTAGGADLVHEEVEVIELHTGEPGDVEIDVDVEELVDGKGVVKKKVKVVTAVDGEITPEMRAKIDAMIGDLEGGEHVWHQKGDGIMVFNTSEGNQKTRIVIRTDDEEVVSAGGQVDVQQTENADGSKTIRIVPQDGSETTIITIQKEKSSKSDN